LQENEKEYLKNRDDATSVDIWVRTVLRPAGCIIYYKAKDKFDKRHPQFHKSEFILAYQNKFQREQLLRLSGMFFVDGTHHVDINGHQLFTVVCQDEYGHGVPVCYVISSTLKIDVLELTLRKMKRSFERKVRVEFPCTVCEQMLCKEKAHKFELKPYYVMADDDAAEHAAIKAVFPLAIILLCHWHLNVTWWRQCKALIKAMYARFIFDILKRLIRADNIPRFNSILKQVTKECKKCKCPKFYEYFEKNYIKRKGNIILLNHTRSNIYNLKCY
jgi:hypothetical protein